MVNNPSPSKISQLSGWHFLSGFYSSYSYPVIPPTMASIFQFFLRYIISRLHCRIWLWTSEWYLIPHGSATRIWWLWRSDSVDLKLRNNQSVAWKLMKAGTFYNIYVFSFTIFSIIHFLFKMEKNKMRNINPYFKIGIFWINNIINPRSEVTNDNINKNIPS